MMTQPSALTFHLEKMRGFCAAAEVGSLFHAAKKLNVSQASLSQSIKTLETALETDLFYRNSRGVSLTQSGHLLYQFAKKVLLEIDSVELKIKNPMEDFRGKIKLGTLEMLAIYFFPDFLKSFASEYPQISLSLACEKPEILLGKLRSNEYHAILSTEPEDKSGLDVIPLLESDIKLYAAPYLANDKLSQSDLKRYQIFSEVFTYSKMNPEVTEWFRNAVNLNRQTLQIGSVEGSLEMAKRGLGLALLPVDFVKKSVVEKMIKPVKLEDSPESFGKLRISAMVVQNSSSDILIKTLLEAMKTFRS